MARFRCSTFKSAAQIARIPDGNLINSASNHNQTCEDFAKAAEIIDQNVQSHTSQIDVRYDGWKWFETSHHLVEIVRMKLLLPKVNNENNLTTTSWFSGVSVSSPMRELNGWIV